MALKAPGEDVPLRIIGQHVRGEELVLGAGRACDVVTDCTIEDCDVVLVNSKALLLGGSRFVNCRIRPKRPVNTSWNTTAWDECDFGGHYLSTHFGIEQPTSGPAAECAYLIRGCDFTRATMHGCVFMRTDVASTNFPPWPCFTVLQPQRNRMAWKEVPAPVPAADFLNRFDSANESGFCDAEVLHWPSIMKSYQEGYRKYRSEATRVVAESDPEEVRRVLRSLDFVRL